MPADLDWDTFRDEVFGLKPELESLIGTALDVDDRSPRIVAACGATVIFVYVDPLVGLPARKILPSVIQIAPSNDE